MMFSCYWSDDASLCLFIRFLQGFFLFFHWQAMSIRDKFGLASDTGVKHAIFCKLSELTGKVGAAAWLLTIGGMIRPDTGRIARRPGYLDAFRPQARCARRLDSEGTGKKVQKNMA